MYMGEKMAYYSKINMAVQDPENYMSIISDGMAQGHTELPWMANLKQFPQTLPQHLQGIIEHGREFVRVLVTSFIFCIFVDLFFFFSGNISYIS
jgi:hypothetical protein